MNEAIRPVMWQWRWADGEMWFECPASAVETWGRSPNVVVRALYSEEALATERAAREADAAELAAWRERGVLREHVQAAIAAKEAAERRRVEAQVAEQCAINEIWEVAERLLAAEAQAARLVDGIERLANDLHLMNSQGETPDGDGITINVQLWAERWIERLRRLVGGSTEENSP